MEVKSDNLTIQRRYVFVIAELKLNNIPVTMVTDVVVWDGVDVGEGEGEAVVTIPV